MKSILARFQIEQEEFITNNISKGRPFPGYKLLVDKGEYAIYSKSHIGKSIVAAYKSVVVTKESNSDVFYIVPDYKNRLIKYRCSLTSRNFPDLIGNSHISKIFVLPFLREIEADTFVKRWRVVVITDKCQVYHNFPDRNKEIAGKEQWGDIARFEESVIWDIPSRKYPSRIRECKDFEQWFPCLPETCYEMHPPVNKESKYGNKGFDEYCFVDSEGIKKKVSRYYFPYRTKHTNPFVYMGGFEADYKLSLVGTYQSNKDIGSRIVVLATSDGGRSWYAKYEFGDEGEYTFKQGLDSWGNNFGNYLVFPNLAMNTNAFFIRRRAINHSGKGLFSWDDPKQIKVIGSDENNRIYIETIISHELNNGNIIAIQSEDLPEQDGLSWIVNNQIGENSSGNGKLFKTEIIDDTKFYLRELVCNPYTNIACRHIHHINRIRDGWIVGTGEVYPNGWLIMMQMLEADTYSRFSGSSELTITILNHSPDSVQRTMGAYILDHDVAKLVFASDHDLLNRNLSSSKFGIRRNSTGVYIGELDAIDSFSEYKLLYEAKEPAYFFKLLDNHYVFCGQRGELAISDVCGEKWYSNRLNNPLIHYYGSTYQFHVIDRYILIFK